MSPENIPFRAMDTDALIEAILFMKGEPLSIGELAALCSVEHPEVEASLTVLDGKLALRGIRLLRDGERVSLATAPEAAPVLERLANDEHTDGLSKAALETLAVVLYRGPIAKSEIDYLRGVNSVYTLRNLMVRGLIERAGTHYRPTLDLMRHLGVTKREELSEFASVLRGLEESMTRESDEQ